MCHHYRPHYNTRYRKQSMSRCRRCHLSCTQPLQSGYSLLCPMHLLMSQSLSNNQNDSSSDASVPCNHCNWSSRYHLHIHSQWLMSDMPSHWSLCWTHSIRCSLSMPSPTLLCHCMHLRCLPLSLLYQRCSSQVSGFHNTRSNWSLSYLSSQLSNYYLSSSDTPYNSLRHRHCIYRCHNRSEMSHPPPHSVQPSLVYMSQIHLCCPHYQTGLQSNNIHRYCCGYIPARCLLLCSNLLMQH